MTLFIGVITTAMEEAQSVQKKQKIQEAEEAEAVSATNLDKKTIAKYQRIFKIIDEDESGKIDEEELREALHKVNLDANLDSVYTLIDNEERKDIDFVSFLIMMKLLKEQAIAQEKGEDLQTVVPEGNEETAEEGPKESEAKGVEDSTDTKEIELASMEKEKGDGTQEQNSVKQDDALATI